MGWLQKENREHSIRSYLGHLKVGFMERLQSYSINYYDQPLVWTTGDAVYDLIGGRYVIGILSNEEPATEFNLALKPTQFTPAQLRRDGIR